MEDSSQAHTTAPVKAKAPRELKFVNVTNFKSTELSRGTLSASRLASKVYIEKLKLRKEQEATVRQLYLTKEVTDEAFDGDDEEEQALAKEMLTVHALDAKLLEAIGSKWKTVWTSPRTGKGDKETYRVLYRCICAYDHELAGVKKRKGFLDFTGCLAHAEITYMTREKRVLRVRGHLVHNEGCKNAEATRRPNFPLHSSVIEVAVRQLSEGGRFSDIQAKNLRLQETRAYAKMPTSETDMRVSPFRWQIFPSDMRSIYRVYDRRLGIKANTKSYINLHRLLDKDSPEFNPALEDAIFHYSARASQGDRVEVCIATKDMKEAAWKHARNSQIILDGTFGICASKILLFIVMAVDEDGHGEPLAFLLFSPPSQNRQTAAGYNNIILTELLSAWKKTLEEEFSGDFAPRVAITDADIMERLALVNVFPSIWLLLCKFHLRQSWTNHLNSSMRGSSPTISNLKSRLKRVEQDIIGAQSFHEAREIIAVEMDRVLRQRSPTDEANADAPAGDGKSPEDGALLHLKYLRDYWTREDLWKSWSDWGRGQASKILKCPVSGVLTTTNHVESFDGVFKRKHLRHYQRNDVRLRFDQLILLIALEIAPTIFKQRRFERREKERLRDIVKSLKGGEKLTDVPPGTGSIVKDSSSPKVAYMSKDEGRDARAEALLSEKQISVPTFHDDRLTFTCYSSLAVHTDIPENVSYDIVLCFDGSGACTCKDFRTQGGACKHMRAAILRTDLLRARFKIPLIPLPSSETEAFEILRRRVELGRKAPLDLVGDSGCSATEAKFDRDPAASIPDISTQPPIHETMAVVASICSPSDNGQDVGTGGSDEGDVVGDGGGDEDDTLGGRLERVDTPEIEAANVRVSSDFDLSPPSIGSAKAGINAQVWARVSSELYELGPKLALYGKFIQESDLPEAERQNVVKFLEDALQLINPLQEKLSGSKGKESELTTTTPSYVALPSPVKDKPNSTPPRPKSSKKRVSYDIIGPSPEKKKQKRHKSYSKH